MTYSFLSNYTQRPGGFAISRMASRGLLWALAILVLTASGAPAQDVDNFRRKYRWSRQKEILL
ncbi:MAG TPA: hypothetical protein VJ417_12420, partial [Candidatus Glassbacteria bacterium]|nr:hypothetical protein [Candidatus Glassbacteria bacterium]